MAVTSAVIAVIGAGIAAYGSVQRGKAEQAINETNARRDENEAIQREMEAREQYRREKANARRYLAQMRASYAGRGVAMEGSPLIAMADAAATLELQALDNARAGRLQAGALRQQGLLRRMYGAQARAAGNLGGLSTAISGASSAAGIYGRSV